MIAFYCKEAISGGTVRVGSRLRSEPSSSSAWWGDRMTRNFQSSHRLAYRIEASENHCLLPRLNDRLSAQAYQY